jgi:hypothetical protein
VRLESSHCVEVGEVIPSGDEGVSKGSEEEDKEGSSVDGVLNVGGQLWVLSAGRTVDPALRSGYARRAGYKLHKLLKSVSWIFLICFSDFHRAEQTGEASGKWLNARLDVRG